MSYAKGKIVLITGATSGIGEAAAHELAKQGATVWILARSVSKSNAVLAAIQEHSPRATVQVLQADLASLKEVDAAVEQFLQHPQGGKLDILMNNAAVIVTSRQLSHDGLELMFAVNHLAHFHLTQKLLPLLLSQKAAPSSGHNIQKPRIINVASGAHAFCKGIRYDDLQWNNNFRTFPAYGHSKLANMLFTRELMKRYGDKIDGWSLHPGAVATGLGTNNGWAGKVFPKLLVPFFRTPRKGAETILYLATSDTVKEPIGSYLCDCKVKQPKPWAEDETSQKRLWEVSEELIQKSISA